MEEIPMVVLGEILPVELEQLNKKGEREGPETIMEVVGMVEPLDPTETEITVYRVGSMRVEMVVQEMPVRVVRGEQHILLVKMVRLEQNMMPRTDQVEVELEELIFKTVVLEELTELVAEVLVLLLPQLRRVQMV
jgi:hypothetical protein